MTDREAEGRAGSGERPLVVRLENPPAPPRGGIARHIPLFISLVALSTSIFSAWQTRVHNRLTHTPYVTSHTAYGQLPESGLFFVNDGLGLAQVRNTRVYYRGQRIASADALFRIEPWFNQPFFRFQTYDHDLSIRAGSRHMLFHADSSQVPDAARWSEFLLRDLFVIAEACSIYGDCRIFCNAPGSCEAQERAVAKTKS
ncbi:MAG: hypothetical protein AB7O45_05110 [Alphaproteobacteria bacterium]